jgi:hypothetical protein
MILDDVLIQIHRPKSRTDSRSVSTRDRIYKHWLSSFGPYRSSGPVRSISWGRYRSASDDEPMSCSYVPTRFIGGV